MSEINPEIKNVECEVSHVQIPVNKAYNAQFLRAQLFELIQRENPQVTRQSYLSPEVVNGYREKYVTALLTAESGELSAMQGEVISSIHKNKIFADFVETEISDNMTFGEKLSDKIAEFGGSWRFIIIFFGMITGWMILNVVFLMNKGFDPYPFILLNLILSCLASIQAPIIMMSQNRKEIKDRMRSENDYKINLKAELEIKLLHEKLDHIIVHQHQRLLEIQEVQREYLQDILDKIEADK